MLGGPFDPPPPLGRSRVKALVLFYFKRDSEQAYKRGGGYIRAGLQAE